MNSTSDAPILGLLRQFHNQGYLSPPASANGGNNTSSFLNSKELCCSLRAMNLLTSIFLRADLIGRELGSRISTSHLSIKIPNILEIGITKHVPFFKYLAHTLLFKLLRIAECVPLVSVCFRLLSSFVFGCENSVNQVRLCDLCFIRCMFIDVR